MWSVKVKQIIIITYRVKLPSADRLRQRVFYLIHEITLDSGRHMIQGATKVLSDSPGLVE